MAKTKKLVHKTNNDKSKKDLEKEYNNYFGQTDIKRPVTYQNQSDEEGEIHKTWVTYGAYEEPI